MPLRNWLLQIFKRDTDVIETPVPASKASTTHVILMDGTMSTLKEGHETNVGLVYKLLCDVNKQADKKLSLYYEPGLQWTDLRSGWNVMVGRGINRQIRRAYGFLASHYEPGDKIILIGFSRGAYAVRSLAGVIDLVGLAKKDHATVRTVRQAYRHYENGPNSLAAQDFKDHFCHKDVPIQAVAVWDTVKALGLVFPVIWRLSVKRHAFHSHSLGHSIAHGFQALAKDETRVAYSPVMWTTDPDWTGTVEQMWFKGTHADVGGQLSGLNQGRPLSNISLVWMLDNLEMCGVPLPEGSQTQFETDATAPSIGRWHGWSKMFLSRRARKIGVDPSERIHPTAQD